MPQPSKQSIERYLEVVEHSGLVSPQAVRDAVVRLQQRMARGDAEDQAADPVELLGQQFIDHGILTRWQQKQLQLGHTRGFHLGPYKLLGRLSQGGMSRLYLGVWEGADKDAPSAWDEETSSLEGLRPGTQVALKVFLNSNRQQTSHFERFRREARMLAGLNHRNVVRGFGLGQQGDTTYFAMQFVLGHDVGWLVERHGALSFAEVAEIIRQAASGLDYLHAKGFVHRDLKPRNLMIDRAGVLKILDLGLALDESATESPTLIHHERLLGTSDYMAPEQARDCHGVDFRADLYSLGCVMYHLLTGAAPFSRGTLTERILHHQNSSPVPVTNHRPDCPRKLAQVCHQLLEKNPASRLPSAEMVREVLTEWQHAVRLSGGQTANLAAPGPSADPADARTHSRHDAAR
jgi:serine/threonine protein kinase